MGSKKKEGALKQNTVNNYHGIPNVASDISLPHRIMSDSLSAYLPSEFSKTSFPSEPEKDDVTKSKSSTTSAEIHKLSYFPEVISSGLNGVGKNQNTEDEVRYFVFKQFHTNVYAC